MNDESLRRQLRDLSAPSPSEAARGRAKHRALLALQGGAVEDSIKTPASWNRAWVGAAFLTLAAIAAVVWFRPHDHGENLAGDRQVLRQVEALFPHQLNAVVQAGGQTNLSLSDAAELGSDQPVLLIFKRQKELIRVLSFSGHRVCVPLGSGESCFEVLETADGGVILEGEKDVVLASRHPVVEGYAFRAQTLSL
jgi:hypothetical protein